MERRKLKIVLAATWLLATALLLLCVGLKMKADRQDNYEKATATAERAGLRVQLVMDSAANITRTTGKGIQTMHTLGIGEEHVMDYLAGLYELNQDIVSSVQYAPDGYVKYIYPSKGNERGKIHLFAAHDRFEEAYYSVNSGNLSIIGPVILRQGTNSIIIRNPVYDKENTVGMEHFLGFSNVTVDVDKLLGKSKITSLDDQGYSYQLDKIDNRQHGVAVRNTIMKTANISETADAASYSFNISGYLFNLHVLPRDGWYNLRENVTIFIVAEIILCLILALINMLTRINRQAEQLEKLSQTDGLTGLKNRLALRNAFLQYIGKPMMITMMDIDDFKYYNDTYGHDMGDTILTKISEALTDSGLNGIFRYGGDEFLILDDCATEEAGLANLLSLRKCLDKITIPGCEPKIKFSFGYVFGVPATAEELRNLQNAADKRLYEQKHAKKAACKNRNRT